MSLQDQREVVVRHYVESGRQERDDQFRRSLVLGPTVRRWLGWAGARVVVLSAYEGHHGSLCPTPWIYEFTGLGENPVRLSSSEINFCDDDNAMELLYPWHQQKSYISELQRELENPILMYHI